MPKLPGLQEHDVVGADGGLTGEAGGILLLGPCGANQGGHEEKQCAATEETDDHGGNKQ